MERMQNLETPGIAFFPKHVSDYMVRCTSCCSAASSMSIFPMRASGARSIVSLLAQRWSAQSRSTTRLEFSIRAHIVCWLQSLQSGSMLRGKKRECGGGIEHQPKKTASLSETRNGKRISNPKPMWSRRYRRPGSLVWYATDRGSFKPRLWAHGEGEDKHAHQGSAVLEANGA